MYAVLHIPRFALQAALRTEEGLASKPVVLVCDSESRPLVLEMTRAAEREGVLLGLTVPQAMARCPETIVRYRSPQGEALAWEAMFCAAYSLAPRVERISDASCLIDLRGVNMDTVESRSVEIVEELEAMGLHARIGIGSSSALALLAAKATKGRGVLVVGKGRSDLGRDQDGGGSRASSWDRLRRSCCKALVLPRYISHTDFIDALPIDAAEPSEATLDILLKWGVRTVGKFAKLKRSAVGARLGVEGLSLWDRVNGRDERVVAVADLDPVFEESWEFEYDVDTLDPLLFLLRRFLDQLCLRMRALGKVAAALEIEIGLAYGEPVTIAQKSPEPSCDVEGLFRLMSGRLEELETESFVKTFALRIDAIEFRQRQYGLFESSLKNPYRYAQTLAKVAGIVGADRVGSPRLESDERPDGFVMEEMAAAYGAAKEGVLKKHYGMPLRRFRPALAAAVELQGRQPVWFKSERAAGFVKACRGPYLHSGHWWETDGSWNRVEWDVELRKGGVYRIVKEDGAWKLEGEYD